jgi:P27 family predicted phage terminase small subunit
MPAGMITAVDADTLACYCEAVTRYRQAAALLARSAPLIRGARSSDLIANPLDRVTRGWADQIRLFARELGLTPSARAGLRMEISPVGSWLEDDIGLPPRLRAVRDG